MTKMPSHILMFLRSKEGQLLIVLSFLFFITSVLYSAGKISQTGNFAVPYNTNIFHAAYSILGIFIALAIVYKTPLTAWRSIFAKILAVLLPTAIVFAYGITVSQNFHYSIQLFVGLYIIIA